MLSLTAKTAASKLEAMLARHLQSIERILQHASFTWQNLMTPLEDMDDELERFWSPASHLHAVVNSPEWRACYQACLPQLSAYSSTISHNKKLYEALKSLKSSSLSAVQQTILDDALLDFELSGVALSEVSQARFEAITARLSELSNQFDDHVLDAVMDYHYHVTDASRLQGLPAHAIETARDVAKEKGVDGWLFSLEYPSFHAVVTYADDRLLREALYYGYVTRASDQGPTAGKFDNSAIMNEILALRHEMAALLGMKHYAEWSLATKMAESPQQVMGFLQELVARVHPQAKKEFATLATFAKEHYALTDLQPWDVAYISEKRKEALFSLSEEALRAYFPQKRVMQGLFTIIERLYGVSFEQISEVDTWHADVECYQILDQQKHVRGIIYMDLFSRPHKRGGAWMDSLQSRRVCADGSIQIPIATLTCNFAKAVGDQPATLSHDEVITLFHEMGHCLHHVLTTVDYISASGIHGVEWDAVELPSQFFENWCWDPEALDLLTAHVETGETLPKAQLDQLLAAKNNQSAMALARQLEFALFDFRMHQEYTTDAASTFISDILMDVRSHISVAPRVDYQRFQHSFSHIFAGGYAAGYYSYLWAEVLSCDAFARFLEEGVWNAKTGKDFLQCILEVGGSRKATVSYTCFRGRMPTVDALLEQNGIIKD